MQLKFSILTPNNEIYSLKDELFQNNLFKNLGYNF